MMNRACVLFLTCCAALWAQRPVISAISIDSLDTTSFRVFFTVNGPAWSEVLYGTSSGVYPYNTKSINCYATTTPCQTNGGPTQLLLTGLTPGTTYYLRVTARPDPNDDLNICNSDDCGSVEQVVTTLNGDQPAPPIAPASWYPTPPDTSSYTVIPLQVGSSGECQAASAANSPDGWTVQAGDTVWTILNEIGYGAVLELPQGAACMVPPQMPGGNPGTGYTLPAKPLDSNPACGGQCTMTNPNHRWIVFRTQQKQTGDFPPFGVRIDPSYAPRLGKFYSSQPNYFSQLFEAENITPPVHHFWWQNVEFEDDPNYVNPADVVDPVAFQFFAQLGSQYQKSNNEFLVLDRVYAHGPGAPIRHANAFELGGNYMAMIGCYTSKVETWRMTAWPSNSGTTNSGNTAIQIPQNNYRYSMTSPMLGMAGPATATLTNATGTGNVIGNLYADHLEIQYSSSIGTIACNGCTALPEATPATPATAFPLFTAQVAGGQFNGVTWNTQEWQTSRYAMALGITFSDLKAPGGPYLFDNNYLDGVGEGFYIDPDYSSFAHDDITYTHNHQIWPKNYFSGAPGNLWRYEVRQHFEIKRGHRFLIKGNWFSYSWSFQNDGPAIFLSGRPTYVAQTLNDGISDISIQSNRISHERTGIACQNGDPMDNNGNSMEPEATKRVSITNNVMFDLGRWKYCDPIGCPSFGSFYFESRPGCQDLSITNNTADVSWGDLPGLLYLGGGNLLGNELTFQKNILHFSQGMQGTGGIFGDWPPNNVTNHDILPAVAFSNTGTAPAFSGNLTQAVVNSGASLVPNYSWSGNVLIGGYTGSSLATATDMSYAQVLGMAVNMPAGDIYPAGDTIAARQATAGLDTSTWRSSVYNPLGVGANVDAVNSAMGLVTGVKAPVPGFDSAVFVYQAPDTQACAVDVSSDGVTWVRTMDSGGAPNRVLTVTGLSPATQYQSKILCYYTQQNDGVLYTDYTPDEITTATFTTTATGRRPQ